jgi:hypothetical protein
MLRFVILVIKKFLIAILCYTNMLLRIPWTNITKGKEAKFSTSAVLYWWDLWETNVALGEVSLRELVF